MKVTPATNAARLYGKGRGAVPSCTEVLKVVEKRHLEDWRRRVGAKEADRVSASAKLFGTKVHASARRAAWGQEEPSEEMRPYWHAVRDFLDEHVSEVLGTEMQLVSERMRFGGTLDLYCTLKNGSHAVVDWKTSATLSREHNWQTAGYALLLRESGRRVNRRVVVRLKKEEPGAYYARFCKEHERDAKGFLACVDLWWALHGKKVVD